MEPLSASDFPPLSVYAGGSSSSTPSRVWKNIVIDSVPISKDLPLSFLPHKPDIIPFAGDRLVKGAENWNLCLVGYSIGRRPYYEALLGAIRKTWTLKGSMQLLSLSDGFFLLRFTIEEDYEMAWSKGMWFFLGRPFLLQKWSPKFRPKRENFTSIPIWVKIHDLPLVCWNSEGISRIASKIGILLAVNSLTAQKTRLIFARVCIQVDASATYPEEIPISIEDDVFSLKIQYEWKPTLCEHCKSMVHASSFCPSKPEAATTNVMHPPQTSLRGRSKSRKPQGRKPTPSSNTPSSTIPPSIALVCPNPQVLTDSITVETTMVQSSLLGPDKQIIAQQNHSLPPLPPQPTSSTIPTQIPPTALLPTPVVSNIPNLNSPHEASSSSTSSSLPLFKPLLPKIQSPNKFDALHLLVEDPDNSADDSSLEIDSSARVKEKEKSQTYSSKQSKNAKGKQSKKTPTANR
ncbi:uncharacterized protein LOC110111614 [Dendrobium catenatum]|uniref:uncharacterized protein LOC110111614 n=1 Tax=Dendrobium catenatum TaxID=906689 RepID=UPI00109FD782|nr:uncharacterized protein LOC110111614 [Dendrobium catenatum]